MTNTKQISITVNIENEHDSLEQLLFGVDDCSSIAENVVRAVLENELCPYDCSVNLLITDDENIRSINLSARDIDSPTDVLSFPMIEFATPSDFSQLEKDPFSFDPETGFLMLGDIVVSADRTAFQAVEYGHGRLREFAFLITHSMLHLLGYDHIEEQDREIMEQKQRDILDKIGITRRTDAE